MTDYDRLCDMGLSLAKACRPVHAANCPQCKNMREPGVEPGCPKAPDPKGGAQLSRPEEKPVNSRFARMRNAQRRTAPHSARSSTTESTTRAGGAR